MLVVVILWLVVAVVMWSHYKFTHQGPMYIANGATQQTFLGALMWPFYLVIFLVSRLRSKKNDKS
jgi:hypothetical protein